MLDITQSADEILGPIDLHGARAHVDVRVLGGEHHLYEVEAIGTHGLGVEVDLVLLDEATHRGHLRHTLGGTERIAHVVVLQGAQLLRVPAAGGLSRLGVAPLEGVPEDLAQGRGVGAQCRLHALGQQSGGQGVEFLEDARTAPVELHVLLENNIDKRHAEHRCRADGLHARDAHECRGERVGHLLLNVLGRMAHPVGGDNLLIVTDVGDGIHGNGVARQESAVPVEGCRCQTTKDYGYQHKECDDSVVQEITDNLVDHRK